MSLNHFREVNVLMCHVVASHDKFHFIFTEDSVSMSGRDRPLSDDLDPSVYLYFDPSNSVANVTRCYCHKLILVLNVPLLPV